MNYNVYLNNELFIARPMLIDLIPETVDASLMIQNVVQSNGIMINIIANEKKKKENFVYAKKKIMLEILACLLGSVIKIVRLMNTWKFIFAWQVVKFC